MPIYPLRHFCCRMHRLATKRTEKKRVEENAKVSFLTQRRHTCSACIVANMEPSVSSRALHQAPRSGTSYYSRQCGRGLRLAYVVSSRIRMKYICTTSNAKNRKSIALIGLRFSRCSEMRLQITRYDGVKLRLLAVRVQIMFLPAARVMDVLVPAAGEN